MALEGVHGNRANADRLATAQSGRALEMMNQGLIWLADNLRVSYGDAILQLTRMIVEASNRMPLLVNTLPLPPLDRTARLRLQWPRWYAPDAQDRAADARTLAQLIDAKILSVESARRSVADLYSLQDLALEGERIVQEAR